MKYTVKKSFSGYVAKYECPGCNIDLRSPIRDAGQKEACPDCGTVYMVPGASEKRRIEAADAAKKEQAEAKKAEAQKSKQEKATATELARKEEAKLQKFKEQAELLLTRNSADDHNTPPQTAAIPAQNLPVASVPHVVHHQQNYPMWRCPYCQGTAGLRWESKISNVGWAMVIILFLVLCWPLFWIGFFIKEQHSYCNTCNTQLS